MAKTTTSKRQQALKIVARQQNRKNVPARKDAIAELVEKTGLTPKGAATYYQNIVSGKWS